MRLSNLTIPAVLLSLLLAGQVGAYPGPGPWSDVAPPEPDGGKAQLSLQFGTPHAYSISFTPLVTGISLDIRLARWAFLTVSGDYAVPIAPSAALGPTFSLGASGPRAFRVVLAPRVGLDGYTDSPIRPSVVLGSHLMLDAPLAANGAARWWVGTSYRFSTLPGEGYTSHYLFLLGGLTFHVSRPVDLGLQIAGNALFRTDVGDSCGCWAPFHALTFTFQFTVHPGVVADQRAVLPPPSRKATSGAGRDGTPGASRAFTR